MQAGQKLRFPASGVSAAYALNDLYLDAGIEEGFVVINAKFAGHTVVFLVDGRSVNAISVEVTAAAPIYPPGFIPPPSAAAGDINGVYALLYNSAQQQVQSLVDFSVQSAARTTQLHLLTSTVMGGSLGARTFLPSAFYTIRTPRWNLTLLDESIRNSPLTVNNSVIRGFHVATRHWRVHTGYTALASFHGFLIPLQRQTVIGVSYVAPFTGNSELSSSLYYFSRPADTFVSGNSGVIGTLAYRFRPSQDLDLLAEVGVGRGVAIAFELDVFKPRDAVKIVFRQKPRLFPSLTINSIPGVQLEAAWTHQVHSNLESMFTLSDNRLLLPLGRQNNLVASESIRARLSRWWSVSTGITHSRFDQSGAAGAYSFASWNLPQSVNFDSAHFGTGFQYQYVHNSESLVAGHEFEQTVRASRGAFSVSGFAEHQTQAIAVESIYSLIPSLQAELLRLGLAASSPQELQALLQDTSFLLALGLSPGSRVNVVPSRFQTGANMNWSTRTRRAQQFGFSFLYGRDQTLLGKSEHFDLSGSHTVQLTQKVTLTSSFFLLHLTQAGASRYYPQAQVEIRRTFTHLPSTLSGFRSGTISGTIFEDPGGRGTLDRDSPAMPAVEVVLDNFQRTLTDKKGFYAFYHVPHGDHVVEVHFQSARPFWFTGSSKIVTSINQEHNLGIRFASGEIVGYLKNDVDIGIRATRISLHGNSYASDAESDADGRFSFPGLNSGDYELSVDPDTLPMGYRAEELRPQHIRIEAGFPTRADFRIKAFRSIEGTVKIFDSAVGAYVPVKDLAVYLLEQKRAVQTNGAGRFAFLDLPAGKFTLMMGSGARAVTRDVIVSAEPQVVRIDIKLDRR